MENKDYFTGKVSYTILIKQWEDLEPLEIAECFKEQYPKMLCVLSFSRIVKIEVGFLFIGLAMPKIKNRTVEVQKR